MSIACAKTNPIEGAKSDSIDTWVYLAIIGDQNLLLLLFPLLIRCQTANTGQNKNKSRWCTWQCVQNVRIHDHTTFQISYCDLPSLGTPLGWCYRSAKLLAKWLSCFGRIKTFIIMDREKNLSADDEDTPRPVSTTYLVIKTIFMVMAPMVMVGKLVSHIQWPGSVR